MLTILKLQGWEWKQHTSRIPFLILNSLNARTDEVRLNKLLHVKLKQAVSFKWDTVQDAVLLQNRKFPKICSYLVSTCPLELRKLVPTLYVSDHKEQRY